MHVAALHGLNAEHIIAFGDSNNDYEMISEAGVGVAMGNALESIKQIADYVTTDIDHDGIWRACTHFKLIGKELTHV